MSFLFAPFVDNEFMRLALVGGLLVGLTCAIAGTFVILRGLAFVGDALAHGILPGIAGALWLGVSGVYGAIVGAIVMMGGVSVVQRRFKLSGDTAIGLLFVGMLALGVIITSRSETFVGDLTRVLFGELLGVSAGDLVFQTVALAIVVAIAFAGRRPFQLLSVDEGLATTSGFNVRLFSNLLLAIVAITVIASFQTVGTLLVLGLLVAPAATGALFARRVSTMMAIAAAVASASVYVGLLASYHFDLAAGASIVFTSVVVFAIAATVREVVKGVAHHDHHHELPHTHGSVHVR